MGVFLVVFGILIVVLNLIAGFFSSLSSSPLSNSDVIRHIDYLIGFLLIASGAIIIAIQAGKKDSQSEKK